MKSPYRAAIVEAANAAGLAAALVEAVVEHESAGRADAFRYEPAYWARYCAHDARWQDEEPRRIASSYGLMQVMYPTALAHGFDGPPEELFDIPTNLRIGCAVLAQLVQEFDGDLFLALAAYNGGPRGVTRTIPQAYARRVLHTYTRLQEPRDVSA